MAKQVIKNAYVLIGGVNLSDHVEQLSLTWRKTVVDITAMGDGGMMHLAGLEDNQFTLTLWQDHAASSVGPTLDAIMLAGTAVAFKIGDNGTVFSVTNPSYSGSAIVSDYQVVGGKVGDGQQSPVTFAVNGVITAGTS